MNYLFFHRFAVRSAILGCIAVLAACATQQNTKAQIDAWVKANPSESSKTHLIIDVPIAGNPVADALMVAVLRVGVRSETVDLIVKVLEQPPVGTLLVTAQNPDIASATLESALHLVSGKASAGHQVVLLGVAAPPASVVNAARAAAVEVKTVPSAQ